MSQVVRFCLRFKMGETDIISHAAGMISGDGW